MPRKPSPRVTAWALLPTQGQALAAIVAHGPGRIVTPEDLAPHVGRAHRAVAVREQVKQLRRRIGPGCILIVRKVGWRITAEFYAECLRLALRNE